MSLSDACGEFLDSFKEATKNAAAELRDSADHYGQEPWGYGPEITALHLACSRVESAPGGLDLGPHLTLVRLAHAIQIGLGFECVAAGPITRAHMLKIVEEVLLA